MNRPVSISQSVLEVTCPRCRQRTDRIHSFEVPVIVFLTVWIDWKNERVAGCPKCVQSRLWNLFLMSIPLANIIFLIVGPFIFFCILTSRITDHPGIPSEFHQWAEVAPYSTTEHGVIDKGKTVRLIVVAVILVSVFAIVLFVLPLLGN